MAGNTTNSLRIKRKAVSRNRVSKACQHCRARKIKCNQSRPSCGNCLLGQYECCYTEDSAPDATQRPKTLSLASPENISPLAPSLPGILTPQGPQKRYISRCSWMSEVFVRDEASAPPSAHSQCSSSPGLAAEAEPTLWLQSIPRSHYTKLMRWFSEHCYIFVPIVEVEEIERLVDACETLQLDEESYLLLATSCHASSLSIEAWRPELTLLYPSDIWRRCVESLFRLCSPSYSIAYIKALVFKAIPSITEGAACPVASPISTLVRSAQLAGLHRDPTRLDIPSEAEAEERRRLFWKVHGLDIAFSVAHGLPTLLRPSSYDVRELDAGSHPGLIFLKHCSRAHMIFSDVLEMTLGHSQATPQVHKDLATAATNFQETIRELGHSWGPSPGVPAKYVQHSLLIISCRAIDAAKECIETFILCAHDFIFAPLKWITGLYNIYQPVVIILRDLIQHPGSAEADDLGHTVAACFEASADDNQYMWERLRRLKSKAWELNGWSANTKLPVGQGIEETTDWDTFFASFANDSAFLDFAQL
ncbi:uncharacterized protein PG998_002105 [Apiospora kogelbergensis]|uniref:uncharacterized protein n=1 Tax=Apiospora kogelbergensis TaxID=1337665 RepID=UPI0031309988